MKVQQARNAWKQTTHRVSLECSAVVTRGAHAVLWVGYFVHIPDEVNSAHSLVDHVLDFNLGPTEVRLPAEVLDGQQRGVHIHPF